MSLGNNFYYNWHYGNEEILVSGNLHIEEMEATL